MVLSAIDPDTMTIITDFVAEDATLDLLTGFGWSVAYRLDIVFDALGDECGAPHGGVILNGRPFANYYIKPVPCTTSRDLRSAQGTLFVETMTHKMSNVA